ncbi:MAG: tRNA threonylcarbamoyladenosine dehydratase [Alphaproteobacteria bacterium]|nr:tRNA threonylcarbamoyladenosine dehydratase [Alphaproteobacteria bacterium]
MADRLMRTRLLLGDDGLEKLQNSTVMVIGCGAVGSYAIEALARGGIGHIKLVDFDVVEESNINRQLFALQSTVGMKKVEVARQRINDISPDIKVDIYDTFLDEKNADEIISNIDFVVDAIDSRNSKIAIYQACQKKKIPFISSMGAALRMDVSKILIDKMEKTSVCPLASFLRKMCKANKIPMDFPVIYSVEQPVKACAENRQMGSLSTITGIFGLTMANYVIKQIILDKKQKM